KDHSSDGGSYDTAKDIVRELYGWKAPEYVGYDFVRVKGRGGKISSSSGDVVTVADCLKIFEPRVLRWIFVGTRPNRELQVSFDLDVIKLYEDFDRTWRLAYTSDDGSRKDKKRLVARRTMQLSDPEHTRLTPGEAPFVPQFRHLSMILQIHDGDLEGTARHYEAEGLVKTDTERTLFRARANCVWNWIELYAPPEFRYKIRSEPAIREDLSADEATVLGRLCEVLAKEPGIREADLVPHMRTLCEGTELDNRSFLPLAYDLLLGRPKGPKMTTLITTMGGERAHRLLSASLKRG
ncbi:MAG: lysine--tRNA ligase, partial [Nannocystaceae bacterium]